jgi:solute:Na+ symporter, SSS family
MMTSFGLAEATKYSCLFPGWFAGICLRGDRDWRPVPAAIMSIGAANLFTRNFWKAYINFGVTALGEARVAKMTSLAVVAGALVFILFLPTQFARSAIAWWPMDSANFACGDCRSGWFRAQGLLAGWAVGFLGGAAASITLYSGLLALAANILVAILVSAVLRRAARGDRDLARAG